MTEVLSNGGVLDEGVLKLAKLLDFVGAGVTVTVAGDKATVSIPGGSGFWTSLVKTVDQTNNSTTLADITEIQFTTVPNTQYTIKMRVFGTTTAAGDHKYQLTHAGTTTRVRRVIRRNVPGAAQAEVVIGTSFDAAAVSITGTVGGDWTLFEDIILQVGASGGVFKLAFAQNTVDAGPTSVFEGSYLEYAVS